MWFLSLPSFFQHTLVATKSWLQILSLRKTSISSRLASEIFAPSLVFKAWKAWINYSNISRGFWNYLLANPGIFLQDFGPVLNQTFRAVKLKSCVLLVWQGHLRLRFCWINFWLKLLSWVVFADSLFFLTHLSLLLCICDIMHFFCVIFVLLN